jgi:hypothetical protein
MRVTSGRTRRTDSHGEKQPADDRHGSRSRPSQAGSSPEGAAFSFPSAAIATQLSGTTRGRRRSVPTAQCYDLLHRGLQGQHTTGESSHAASPLRDVLESRGGGRVDARSRQGCADERKRQAECGGRGGDALAETDDDGGGGGGGGGGGVSAGKSVSRSDRRGGGNE